MLNGIAPWGSALFDGALFDGAHFNGAILAAIDWAAEFPAIIETVIYFVLAMVLFGLAVLACDKFTPFSVRKEVEEDQNTALAILMGSGLIAVSIIIAAVVK